jgi:hypothetical protein
MQEYRGNRKNNCFVYKYVDRSESSLAAKGGKTEMMKLG